MFTWARLSIASAMIGVLMLAGVVRDELEQSTNPITEQLTGQP